MNSMNLFVRSLRLAGDVTLDNYPFNIPSIKALQTELEFSDPVTIIIGENGSGKSTMIEALAIACGFNPEGGSKNFNFSSEDSHSPLHDSVIVTKGVKLPRDGFFLRAESYYNVATNLDKLDEGSGALTQYYGGKSLHNQSHGESFIALIRNRLGGNGLYIFDEPESALSPSRQMELIAHMKRLVDSGSQIVMATHSPMLMAYPGADIICLSEEGVARQKLEMTDHFLLYKAFMLNPEGFMQNITSKI
jgi:predicted ATPase